MELRALPEVCEFVPVRVGCAIICRRYNPAASAVCVSLVSFRMMTYKRLSSALLYVGFFLSVVSRTEAQAPGDGDPICTDNFVNGMVNPFFALRPTYSPNERPLMDSRDYVGLLQGGDIPWQSIDNDDNNTAEAITAVSFELETRNR